MPDQAPDIDLPPGSCGRLYYDKERKTIRRRIERRRDLHGGGPDFVVYQAALDEIERLHNLSVMNAKSWDSIVMERDQLRRVAKWISANYANQEMNHVDFRVEAKRLADSAL
jgi:hypothetical protein